MASRTQVAETRPEPARADTSIPSILAIVVTHDGRSWLRDCLVGLANQTYPMLDVLVVDDASPDARHRPSLKRIAKRHLRRRRWGFLRTPRPLGFGGAINWAMARVRTDADFLLFLHDDALLDPRAVELLVARMLADENTAVVGPKIVSWDDPDRLEEVGMAVDRLGYPYKGLDEGEIDLGQHDAATEVFYVTSTCMLVKHDVFRDVRGWDATLRAFSEDLDLGWRVRLAGHSIRVEPRARARHAIALARGLRRSPFNPARYYIRRNRLRTITKNAAAIRLVWLLPLYFLVSLAEMLAFIVLRQPREVLNLARGLGWNLVHLPQTLSERARVQRKRAVSDLSLLRLTVREATRIRAYVEQQADRLEEAWGRRAELVARRTQEARALGTRLRGWTAVVAVLALVGFALAFRHLLWAPPASVGELLPYPDRATALWRAFASPWHAAGLGQPGPTPPALALLGAFPFLSLGDVGAAQKLLVLGLGAVAAAGAYRLVAQMVDRPGRVAAAVVYALGAVGYAGVREGALGALVFGAAAPFVITSTLRLIGWMRPPGWVRGRAVARVALGSAISAAFVPGSLVFYVVAGVLLSATRTFFDRRSKALRGLVSTLVGLVAGWFLLLPWSTTWFADGGVFDRLRGANWRAYARTFDGSGVASVVTGQTPDAPALFGVALPLLGLIAVVVGEGQRRRLALALWTLVIADAWLVAAIAHGSLRPIVASPTEAGILGSVAFAGLAGVAVGAFRLDLPRRGLGLVHALTLGGMAAAALLVVAGLAPAVLAGAWDPGAGFGRAGARTVGEVRDLLGLEAEQEGYFRALWVGPMWTPPTGSAARPIERHMVTGPRGQVLSDLFERRGSAAEEQLHDVLASIEDGATNRGGTLLGAFNIRYIVLERGPGAYRWLRQTDLGLIRAEDTYLLLEAERAMPRAAVYDQVPPQLRAIAESDAALLAAPSAAPHYELDQRSASRFVADDARGGGTLVLAEARHDGWTAFADGRELEPVDAGWANGFAVPEDASDAVVVRYRRSLAGVVGFLVIGLAWIVVVGGALSRRHRRSPATRRSP